ncbi:MAG: hypothetical protein J7L86_06640 [Candidatus Marinimicrobia bacterium]|nr:hypothetical protein [Candidatus Neomarinimicrobiota bacterium]
MTENLKQWRLEFCFAIMQKINLYLEATAQEGFKVKQTDAYLHHGAFIDKIQ